MTQKNRPKLRFPEFRGMPEWEEKRADNIFKNVSNKKHNSDLPILAITQEHGAIPRDIINYNVIVSKNSVSNYKIVDIGDFIISLRSFQGGIEYSEYKGLCSPAYIILKKDINLCNIFFKYLFKTNKLIRDLNKNIEGIRDGKIVSYKQFSELQLPFPTLPEQQKIADCLTSLDECISAENDKLAQLKAHKKGLMQKLFPREGQEYPDYRFPEFQNAPAWEEKKLGELAEIVRGSSPRPIQDPKWFDDNSDIGWLRISDVTEQNGRIKKLVQKISKLGQEKTRVLTTPHLLLSIAATVGKPVINYVKTGVHDGFLIFLEPKFDQEFMFQWFENFRRDLRSYGQHGSQLNLNSNLVKNLQIKIPTLPEQQKIADCLSALDDLISAQNEKITQLKLHKKGLMQQLFI